MEEPNTKSNAAPEADSSRQAEGPQGSLPAFLEGSLEKPEAGDLATPVDEVELVAEPADGSGSGDEEASSMGAAVGKFFAEGVAGMKEMNSAHRAHAEARDELERLESTIRSREQELDHRRDIEARYPSIVEAETARKAKAEAVRAEAEARQDELRREIGQLKEKLEAMKEADATVERRLKSALDAAEDKEKSARESGKRLQRRLDDATRNLDRARKEREEGVAAAQQAIASAQALLDTLNGELADLQRTPSANPAEYSVRMGELQTEISDAAAALRQAQDDLPRIQYETQTAIDAAAAAVAEAEKPIAPAREAFNAVLAEADAARDAYGTAKDEAEARQKDLRKQISEVEKAVKEQMRAAEEAQGNAEAAQAAIDEANDIHAHPEATESLVGALESDRAERIELVAEVEQLAAAERDVRVRTRGSRMKLITFFAGVALVVILMLVWFFVVNK